MHLHLVRVVARPKDVPRPAKVVQLEARRKARLEPRRSSGSPRGLPRKNDEPRCGSSCGCGGTGIRTGLRSRRSQDHEGSTPSVRTSPAATTNERRSR